MAIEQLDRILDNMKEARKLMKEVDDMEKELRFNAAQLRDGKSTSNHPNDPYILY